MAFARAEDGAYKNLVGMAQAAATDKGPNPDDAPANPSRGTDALKDAIADVPAPAPPAAASRPDASGALRPAAFRLDPAASEDAPPSRPRLWTRLSATLRPSPRRSTVPPGSFETAVSTGAVRAPAPLAALMPPPDSEAVKAGERRGLAELLSTSAAEAGQ